MKKLRGIVATSFLFLIIPNSPSRSVNRKIYLIQEITVEENQVLVRLNGSLYVEEAAQIRDSLIGHIDKRHQTFIIDLGGVDYIDSSGLGMLVVIQKRALQKGGSVVIKGLHGLVKDLFELTRLDKVFEIQ